MVQYDEVMNSISEENYRGAIMTLTQEHVSDQEVTSNFFVWQPLQYLVGESRGRERETTVNISQIQLFLSLAPPPPFSLSHSLSLSLYFYF